MSAGAKDAVDKVLDPSVAPEDFGAQSYRMDLDDPIRTNPALSKEHAGDVDEVRRLIYTAQGAFDLGKYDQAKEFYEEVLRIDPYNTAARRGMERLSSQKSGYYDSAKDQSRAELLGNGGRFLGASPSPQSCCAGSWRGWKNLAYQMGWCR